METTPGRDEYVVSDAVAPNSPCHVPDSDVVSEFWLSELPSSIRSDEETKNEAFFVQTCLEDPYSPLLPMSREAPLDEELDPRSKLREYVDSKKRFVAKKLCYAKPTRRSWPLEQGSMGDISILDEDLEQTITTWQ